MSQWGQVPTWVYADREIRSRVIKRFGRSRGDGSPVPAIDGFEDLTEIGSGGFSRVYQARETALASRRVALKVLDTGVTSDAERRAFENECAAMGVLSEHPYVVPIYRTTFTSRSRPCIVMPVYPNKSTHDRLKTGGRFSVDETLDIGVKIAGALQTAHNSGLRHRDLKPQNILLSQFDEPALADFGISTFDDERTRTGDAGALSLPYASPEVARGEEGERSDKADLYSLGATLYALLAGHGPFSAPGQTKGMGALFSRVLHDPPPPIGRADVPPSLERLLQSTLAKEPAMRPQSPEAFGRALQDIQRERGTAVTQLLVDTPSSAGLADVTLPRDAIGAAPPPRSPQQHPPTPPSEEADTPSVTIARPKPPEPAPAPPQPPEPGDAPSSNRRLLAWIGAGVAGAALLAAVLFFGLGGEGSTTTTGVPTTIADDGFFDFVSAPTDVILVSGTDGTVVVSWSEVAGAAFYEVQRRDAGAGASAPMQTDKPPLAFDPGSATNPCVDVVTIGESGRISHPSDVVCLE